MAKPSNEKSPGQIWIYKRLVWLAINFLATAGACFIILAVEEKILMQCLDKKLDWLEELPVVESAQDGKSRSELWLEKLLQVRIKIPALTDKEFKALLSDGKERDSETDGKKWQAADLNRLVAFALKLFIRSVKALMLVGLIMGVAFGAWMLGTWFSPQPKSKNGEKPPAWVSAVPLTGKINNADVSLSLEPKGQNLPSAAASPVPLVSPPSGLLPKRSPPSAPLAQAIPSKLESVSVSWPWIIIVGISVVLATLYTIAIRDIPTIEDSKKFTETLEKFLPCIGLFII